MNTQYLRALVRIREMILRGSLVSGQRVSEAVLAEMLEMTRTPIRQALPALAQQNGNTGSTRVDGVFDNFLHHGRRPLDHFPRRYAVHE